MRRAGEGRGKGQEGRGKGQGGEGKDRRGWDMGGGGRRGEMKRYRGRGGEGQEVMGRVESEKWVGVDKRQSCPSLIVLAPNCLCPTPPP